ncbi:hypothetical protein [Chitinophaga defluvii]|uniref:DUF4352 domain-containing protein n=1 Tax=Chitinophaga defluvii TaxID=3163343 RepID=A0ABV2T2N0_9BACT
MRKQILIPAAALIIMSGMASCGNKAKTADTQETTATTTPESAAPTPVGNQPLSYVVKISPDSAILGKKGEAFIKFEDGNAIALQDADGKSTGTEVTIKMSITNRSKLDNKTYFTVEFSNARLELDNGTAITYKTSDGTTNPEAESTSQASVIFDVPAGAKPAKLSLFLDGTRVSTGISLEEKK